MYMYTLAALIKNLHVQCIHVGYIFDIIKISILVLLKYNLTGKYNKVL